MKLNKVILSGVVALSCVSASAQEADKTVNVFTPHWYAQAQIGGQYTLGEIGFGKLLSPNVQVGIGYNFNKVVGARLSLNAWQSKAGQNVAGNVYKWKWNYVAPMVDATFNLTNLFCEYNPDRLVEVGVFGGIGANIAWGNDEAADAKAAILKSEAATEALKYGATPLENLWDGTKTRFVARVGANVDFRVSDRVKLGVELSANTLSDKYNSKKAGNPDWYFNALAGLRINLGKSATKKEKPVEPEPAPAPVQKVEEPAPAPAPVEKKVEEIRRDIFQQRYSIPNYLGTASTAVYGNLAKVKNYGFDLSLDYGKQINKDLAIQFKGTFTFARNEILEYDEAPGVRPSLSNIGKKLNTIYGYVTDGLYIDQADIANSPSSTLGNIAIAPGDIKYVDQPDRDGVYDGKITSDDRVAMGYPTVPEIVYGFGPSISYKNWDFSFFFQGVANTSLMMSGFAPFGTQYNRNVLSWIADDYWSPSNQNPNAAYPRLTKNDNNHNTQSSDYWLRNGAFLKLKNAEIGYTWKKVRFYISGANLLTFSPFDLWDPEMGGGKGLSYPTQRTFNLGLQLSFK